MRSKRTNGIRVRQKRKQTYVKTGITDDRSSAGFFMCLGMKYIVFRGE